MSPPHDDAFNAPSRPLEVRTDAPPPRVHVTRRGASAPTMVPTTQHPELEPVIADDSAPSPAEPPPGGGPTLMPTAVAGRDRLRPTIAPEIPPEIPTDAPTPKAPEGKPTATSAKPTAPGRVALRGGARLGRWVLERKLGDGATAVVWSAHHAHLGSPVAIKIFKGSSRDFQTVLGEARAAAGIPSPNVIWVYDVDTFGGHHAIVMELCGERDQVGETLREVVIANPEHAAQLMAQAARGVAAAHEGKVFHKDIKPANILVNPEDGRAQISDFGLANPVLWQTLERQVRREAQSTVCVHLAPSAPAGQERGHSDIRGHVRVGTPEFMAPEQAAGLRFDLDPDDPTHNHYLRAIDVYGLGATLYCLLADYTPYPHGDLDPSSATAEDIMAQVVAGPPPPIRQLAPHVPRRLAAIIEKAMARDPLERHASAEDLALDLERWIAGRPTALDRNPLVRGAIHLWRERARVALMTLLAGLTIGTSYVVVRNARHITDQQSKLAEQAIDISTTNDRLAELEVARLSLSQAVATTQSDLAATRTDLRQKEGQIVANKRELQLRAAKLSKAHASLSTTATTLQERTALLQNTEAELTAARDAKARLDAEASTARAALASTNTQLSTTEKALAAAHKQHETAATQVDALRQQVTQLTADLQREKATSAEKLAVADDTRHVLEDARRRLTEAEAALVDLRAENQHLRSLLE